MVFGLLIACVNKFGKSKPKKTDFGCEGCPQADICGKTGSNDKKGAVKND